MVDRPSSADATTGASRPERPSSRRGGLGRGLGALIPTGSQPGPQSAPSATELPIDAIEPNPFQPRATMDPDKLQLLADSIRQHGVIQPLIVKASSRPDRYILIAGERRWRASKQAGLTVVPAVVKDAAPQAMLEMALVENVVRADLSPLEEAQAYRQLIEEFNLTQANVAERVGRSRVSITNTLRLLAAPEQIQQALSAGRISEGHARALLGLPTSADQVAMLDVVFSRDLTVRQTEDAVRKWLASAGPKKAARERDVEEARLEDRFRSALGTKVQFRRNPNGGGGALTIEYYSDEEVDALYRRLLGEDIW
jgi:ParB family chromosome partitioning protein